MPLSFIENGLKLVRDALALMRVEMTVLETPSLMNRFGNRVRSVFATGLKRVRRES